MKQFKKLALFSVLSLSMLGCTSTQNSGSNPIKSVSSLYDYQLLSPDGNEISIEQLVSQHSDANVFMVGEFHAHPGVHLFQAKLMAHLAAQNIPLALSMEQFTRSDQGILSQYVAGEVGEITLTKKTKVWDNYKSDYRPLVEIAKEQSLPVIAANAPRDIVKCIGRQGPQYLSKLSTQQRALVANTIDISDSPYRQKFLSNMRGMSLNEKRIGQMFGAQMAWDATMAESIANHLTNNPNHRVFHIAGRFHIMNGLGTGAELKKLKPHVNIVNITATMAQEKSEIQDYQLIIKALPPMWVNDDERTLVMSGHKRSKLNCL
ncbi:ChaN family lipoprotein [Psychrobium sp. nBUS_13]|uniref:ChaN family lipoprotein n=1 Tax=Psychrobium sp. nBUS_13 TaxID=3395319 RepID=UPI003EBAB867